MSRDGAFVLPPLLREHVEDGGAAELERLLDDVQVLSRDEQGAGLQVKLVGVQVVGRFGHDAELLRNALWIERAFTSAST